MSDNKFILQLKGTQTPKSVVEIKNDKLVAPFVNVPGSSDAVGSIIDDKDSSVVVAKGAQNWKLDGSSLVVASSLSGDGADYTSEFNVSGSGLWINATYSLPATIFSAGTKWALKLCGKNLLTTSGQTIGFTLIVKIGNAHITSKTFTVVEGANVFCRQLIIDFSESEQSVIKAQSGDGLTVQLLCSDTNASATIYNGMTVFTALQRRVDGEAVASNTKTFDEVVQDIDDINDEIDQIHEDIETIQDDIVDINGKIIIRSATIPTASADLVGKAYQYSGTTNGVYTHNYIYECQEIETNSYGWVRVDVQPDRIAQIQALQADITDIQALIPAQASPTNQLGDKNFINSSIATNTANFIGTFNSVAELNAYSGTKTNNDYAFVVGTDSAGNTTYSRYKYTTATTPASWAYEYTLNNSSFTAAQWAAINSGVTATDVTKARSAVQPSDLGNGTITFRQGGTVKGTITTNQSTDSIIDLDAGGGSGRNVGDVFFTTRTDDELNGAVECNGATYNTGDFTGSGSIGTLLAAGRVPYVSLAQYATLLSSQGSCGVFGWDGAGATSFRVPSLNDIFVETGTATQAGDYIAPSLPNITGLINVNDGNHPWADGAFSTGEQFSARGWDGSANVGRGYSFSAANSNPIYNGTTVQPKAVRYRAMVQLATSATDEAVEICTAVLSDVAELKGYDYVVDFQAPTSANNYTWYRKYKNGWVEQGGVVASMPSSKYQDVVFPVTMASEHYAPSVTASWSEGATGQNEGAQNLTTTGMRVTASLATAMVWWRVSGMAAS